MPDWQVTHADCREAMQALPESSIDAIVCDPPYGLSFMGKAWDGFGTPAGFQSWSESWAREALRVLKPGGHMLAFGGTRTAHRLAAGIEDAGFEIRDTLCWLNGSGFPKSLDVSKAIDKAAGAEREVIGQREVTRDLARNGRTGDEAISPVPVHSATLDVTAPATPDAERWQGWGTALKPAYEPVILARKPLRGTVAANVQEHGTGALNIDATRIHTEGSEARAYTVKRLKPGATLEKTGGNWRPEDGEELPWEAGREYHGETKAGRWPANVLLDETAAQQLDAQSGDRPSRGGAAFDQWVGGGGYGGRIGANKADRREIGFGDTGGASRFFYTAKASRAERNTGLHHLPAEFRATMSGGNHERRDERAGNQRTGTVAQNTHPTVKPVALMRWLCRLVTPPGGVILDPFIGSGSTGIAALLEGFNFHGIEQEAEYVVIAEARLAAWEEFLPPRTILDDNLTLDDIDA